MKKFAVALAIVALAGAAHADGRGHHHHNRGGDIAAALIIGGMVGAAIAAPAPVYVPPPQPAYPIYGGYAQPRVYVPAPRYVTSTDPCYQYGQMVMTYDQNGAPMGYQICR